MATSTLVNTIQDGSRPSPLPPIEHYWDISDTSRLVGSKPGHFWCYTHLLDMPLEVQSIDPRYCRECYEILKVEYQDMVLTRGKRKPWWMPVNGTSLKTPPQVQEQGAVIMSTSNGKKNTVDIFPPAPVVRRGPKKKSLPMELIAQLAGQDLGSKAIASRLNADGIAVSYRTIQRQLQGVMS